MSNVSKIVDNYTADIVAEMITVLKQDGSKNLYNEINYDLVINDMEEVMSVITMPDEAYYASEGRARGKFPPLKDIKDWMDSRNIDMEALYPIARKIAKMGTKADALHFLELFKLTPRFEQTVLEGFTEDVKNKIIEFTESLPNVTAE